MSDNLFTGINTEHILSALAQIDTEGVRPGRQSTTYDLLYENKKYPPKYVLSLAGKHATGTEIDSNDFEGGVGTDAFILLENLKFKIIPKNDKSDFVVELINKYKIRIAQTKLQNEIYKWKLLYQFSGRPSIDAIDFYEDVKAVNFANLIYPMGLAVIYHLAKERTDEYKDCFKFLFDEKTNLTQRIIAFNQETLKIYRNLVPGSTLSHHHDERTIATFLCFHNPDKYTFYKDSFYRKYCKLLGISSEKKGKKYVHYLALIDDLIDNYIKNDKELTDLVSSFFTRDTFKDSNFKLLAQDILFQMLDNGTEEINMGISSVYKISMGEFTLNEFDDCINERTVLVHANTKPKGQSYNSQGADFKEKMKKGDYFYLTHGNNANGIRLLGKIISDAKPASYNEYGAEGWLERDFEIVLNSINKSTYKGVQKWWTPNDNSTFINIKRQELEEANKLIFLPFFNVKLISEAEIEIEEPLQKEPELINVKMNEIQKNYILYGPPGTGKTYNSIDKAIEIALGNSLGDHDANKLEFDRLRREGQIEFVTFHQNYNYEDFMVGISPDVTSGSLRFDKKEGVFKLLNDRAKSNWLSSVNPDEPRIDFDHVFNSFFTKLIEEEVDQIEIPMKSKGYAFEVTKIDFDEGRIKFTKKSGGTGHDLLIKNIKGIYEGTLDYGSEGLGVYYYPLDEKLKEYAITIASSASNKVGLKKYVLIIDEINRANISKVFGELITLLEEDKRLGEVNELKITLPNGEKDFGVPPNLYLIGTMNTADKSIALIDIALRRRFEFVGKYPTYENLDANEAALLQKINEAIYEEKKTADYLIGHAYFMKKQPIEAVLRSKVIPLLMEYFSGRTETVSKIFNNTDWKVDYNKISYSWNINPKDK